MLVKAKARGFDGQVVREKGEVFEFKGKLGRWMEPYKAEAPKAEKPVEAKAPVAKGKKATGDQEVI